MEQTRAGFNLLSEINNFFKDKKNNVKDIGCQTVMAEEWKTNEASITIALAYCLKYVSRTQTKKGETRQSPANFLSLGSRAGSLGTSWDL